MRLHDTLTLACAFGTEGESLDFEQQILKALQGTKVMPLALHLACQQIQLNANPAVLAYKPIKAVKIVHDLGDDRKSGRYLPQGPTILLRENVAMRMNLLQLFIHEYSHHIDEVFLKDSPLRVLAVKEYEMEKARVEAIMGMPIEDAMDNEWKEMWAAGTNGATLYSLRNSAEWIAEAGALVFSGYANVLDGFAPKTNMALQAALNGSLL